MSQVKPTRRPVRPAVDEAFDRAVCRMLRRAAAETDDPRARWWFLSLAAGRALPQPWAKRSVRERRRR
jgi:hypothetical protein